MILYIFRIGPVVLRDCKLSKLLPFTHTILSCSERWICYKYAEYAVAFCLADMSSQYPGLPLPPPKTQSAIWTYQKTTRLLGIKMVYVSADARKSFLLSSLLPSHPPSLPSSSLLPFLLHFFLLYFLSLPLFLMTGVSRKLCEFGIHKNCKIH